MADDGEDLMAGLRLLFLLHQRRKRQRKHRTKKTAPSVGDERVPRLPTALTEQDLFFAQISSNANPRVFRENFRVDREHFDRLFELCEPHIDDATRSKRELLGVVFHWLATGSVVRQQETKFQIAYSTCREYRVAGIAVLTTALSHFVRLPTRVPDEFAQRYPHFNQALGAIDGTHVEVTVAAADSNQFRSRKTTITTNVLIFSDWDMNICYVHAGPEGSAHDALVLSLSGLMVEIPQDYQVLADAGYALTAQVLTPYRGVRYHLRGWSSEFRRSPRNPRELYNLRHSTARNVVERAIGVLKRRFKILRTKNESELETAKLAIFATCCVHNFIRRCNPDDLAEDLADAAEEGGRVQHRNAQEAAAAEEDPIPYDFESATAQRNYITRQMWLSYRTALHERGQRIR